MFFLNPWLLLGLGAVAVPIIIHLTGRRRYKTMPWAAMDFLLESHRETARRLKLLQLLLLATRVAILALLALALARPTLSGESWLASFGVGSRAVCIVIDSSYSMGYRPESRTLFEEAKNLAGTIASSLSPGDTLSVILASDRAQVLLAGESRPSLIDRALEEAAISSRPTDLYPAVREGIRLLSESAEVDRGLYIITDGCANAWRKDRSQNWAALAAEVAGESNPPLITLLLLGRPDAANAAVTEVVFKEKILTIPRTVSLDVAAERWGASGEGNCTFAIWLDGEEQGTVVAPWSMSQGPVRAVATVHLRIDSPGHHSGRVRITEGLLPVDDQRYFAFSARRSVPVLCVDGDPAERPGRAETFFLATALAPGGSNVSSSPIEVTVIPSSDFSSAFIDQSEVVILANVADLSPTMVQSLKDRVGEGAALIIFPGDRVRPESYSTLFGDGFMPADLLSPVGALGDEADPVTFGRPNQRHPAMSWFQPSHLPELARVLVYRFFPLSVASGESAPTVLLSFSSGEPAILEHEYGLGKVVLFAFPADAEWTNFPTQPLYLPLLHSLVYHLASDGSGIADLRVGETFSLRLQPGEELPRVTSENGTLLGRMMRGEDGWATFGQTEQPGLFLASCEEETRSFAVNLDTSESDPTLLPPARITDRLSGLPVIIRSAVKGVDPAGTPRGPVEIWPIVLTAALFMSLIELLVARYLGRPKARVPVSALPGRSSSKSANP